MKILVIEDNDLVSDAIARALKLAAFEVTCAGSAESAQALLAGESFDLAIVDIGLPGIDGLSFIRRIRSKGDHLPTIILTARHAVSDKVKALNLGADDFLIKPFDPAELVARCQALIRRANLHKGNSIAIGKLTVDIPGKRIELEGKEVELTAREWAIFECLATNERKFVSKARLLQAISDWQHEVTENAVEVYVSRLRIKLGKAATIRSARGLGYRLEQPQADEPDDALDQ